MLILIIMGQTLLFGPAGLRDASHSTRALYGFVKPWDAPNVHIDSSVVYGRTVGGITETKLPRNCHVLFLAQ